MFFQYFFEMTYCIAIIQHFVDRKAADLTIYKEFCNDKLNIRRRDKCFIDRCTLALHLVLFPAGCTRPFLK